MKFIFEMLIVLMVTGQFALAQSSNKPVFGTDGHGGGGIERNGKYLTFKDAGITVTADSLTEVPQLEQFDQIIQKLQVDTSWKARLYDSYINNGDRKYFRIEDDEDYKHGADPIKNAYSKIAAVGKQFTVDDIKLFAITQGRETYLFPAYFALGSTEQLAILWIEMLWAGDFVRNYNDALDSEIRFQTYIESGKAPGYERNFYENLARILNAPSIYIHAAAEDDLQAGRLKNFIDENGLFYFAKIFGEQSLHNGSYLHSERDYGVFFIPHGGGKAGEEFNLRGSKTNFAEWLFTSMTQHPDVEFLKALYSFRNSMEGLKTTVIRAQLIPDADLSSLGVRIDLLGRITDPKIKPAYIDRINNKKFDYDRCVSVYQGPKPGHRGDISHYASFDQSDYSRFDFAETWSVCF